MYYTLNGKIGKVHISSHCSLGKNDDSLVVVVTRDLDKSRTVGFTRWLRIQSLVAPMTRSTPVRVLLMGGVCVDTDKEGFSKSPHKDIKGIFHPPPLLCLLIYEPSDINHGSFRCKVRCIPFVNFFSFPGPSPLPC